MKKLDDAISGIRQFLKFGLVGILNTVIGTAVMFFSYNVLGLGYWLSSALNYIVGSICSYVLNKRFTFESRRKSKSEIFRFIINISTCYLVAYGVAEPLVRHMILLLRINWDKSLLEQVAMLFGMCLFVILNFMGQKLFVFK